MTTKALSRALDAIHLAVALLDAPMEGRAVLDTGRVAP